MIFTIKIPLSADFISSQNISEISLWKWQQNLFKLENVLEKWDLINFIGSFCPEIMGTHTHTHKSLTMSSPQFSMLLTHGRQSCDDKLSNVKTGDNFASSHPCKNPAQDCVLFVWIMSAHNKMSGLLEIGGRDSCVFCWAGGNTQNFFKIWNKMKSFEKPQSHWTFIKQ